MDQQIPSLAAERFHYYDRHPTAEDLMGESGAQHQVISYLEQVLSWLLRDAATYLARDMNIYTRRERRQYPVAPDLALFSGVQLSQAMIRRMRSWRLYEPNRPAPSFVFEAASDETWQRDLYEKPAIYAALGVTEYCLYDPNLPQYVPDAALRLWRRSGTELLPVAPDGAGRLWSNVLASWLIADEGLVRLADIDGVWRPTEGEAERAQAAAERARANAERAQVAAERARSAALIAKLRALGIDPETLE